MKRTTCMIVGGSADRRTAAADTLAAAIPGLTWISSATIAKALGQADLGETLWLLLSPERGHAEAAVLAQLGCADPIDGAALAGADLVAAVRAGLSAREGAPPSNAGRQVSDQLRVRLVDIGAERLFPGRRYGITLGGQEAVAWITGIREQFEPASGRAPTVKMAIPGDIAVCNIGLDRRVTFSAFKDDPEGGWFRLLDLEAGKPVAVGTVEFGLWRADNISFQPMAIDKAARAEALGQEPAVLWFTGLSGAGKSSVASRVEQKLQAMGRATYVLDGDNVRHGLNRDLGFTEVDRVENIRRFAEVAKLFADAGLIVCVSVISPFRSERAMARDLMAPGEFIEVFVDAPLAVCEERDPKGLYAKARQGLIKNFTGIDSPYEPPLEPDLVLDTGALDVEAAADRVIAFLESR